MKYNQMHFDPASQRWCVDLNGQEYDLHCGEHLDIFIAGRFIPCRLEMDDQWYVVMERARFNLRIWDKYLVRG